MNIPLKISAIDWKSLVLWVLGGLVAMLSLGAYVRFEASQHLQRSAESAGLRWAHFASRTVPDLEAAMSGKAPSVAAREQLLRLRQADGVFRFKLFDPQGNLVLVSDSLVAPASTPAPAAASAQEGIGTHHNGGGKAYIRDKVLAGGSHVELKRDTRADRPAVYSEAYLPVVREGRVLGVVEVYVDQAEQARTIEQAFARIAVAVVGVVVLVLAAVGWRVVKHGRQQREAEARVRYLAHHDVLSGAMNRASFNEALKRAIWRHEKGGSGFALLCVDLDRFKEVNDGHGHSAGDELLRLATQRLRDSVREGDKVARLGGDEFAVLLLGAATAAQVSPLAQRIVTALAEPYDVEGRRVFCAGSVGIAIHGIDANEQADLMHKADLALYRAKAAGRGVYSFYDSRAGDELKARRELARDLQDALAQQQMSLHYQPLHDSVTGALTGYEALLRWQHPKRGNVPPMEFIALAEDSGLIDTLGGWVVNRACADAAGWPDPLSVAVNLSPAQFERGDIVQVVSAALASSGLAAHRLEVEITESMLLRNAEPVLAQLRGLSDLGVAIAMDDFGTGYSSLAYLWRFPFDKVKIDRAFTQSLGSDPKVQLIVSSIIQLAHSLDIRVNAEGVETLHQAEALREQGVDELQGFLLGRPGPLAGLTHEGHLVAGHARATRPVPRASLFADLPAEEKLPNWRPTAPAPL